jgi:ATP-dependent DNA helicase RecQ
MHSYKGALLLQSSHQVLQDVFGFDQFRGAQESIVGHVVAGGDALVLMPTGAR